MEKTGSLILQTFLLIWIVLRSFNVVPSIQLDTKLFFYQFLMGLIILLLALVDPLVGILCTFLLLINLKTSNVETMFVCIDEEDISDIINTISDVEPNDIKSSAVTHVNKIVDKKMNPKEPVKAMTNPKEPVKAMTNPKEPVKAMMNPK